MKRLVVLVGIVAIIAFVGSVVAWMLYDWYVSFGDYVGMPWVAVFGMLVAGVLLTTGYVGLVNCFPSHPPRPIKDQSYRNRRY